MVQHQVDMRELSEHAETLKSIGGDTKLVRDINHLLSQCDILTNHVRSCVDSRKWILDICHKFEDKNKLIYATLEECQREMADVSLNTLTPSESLLKYQVCYCVS